MIKHTIIPTDPVIVEFCRYDSYKFTQNEPEQLGIELPDNIFRAINKRQAEFTAG